MKGADIPREVYEAGEMARDDELERQAKIPAPLRAAAEALFGCPGCSTCEKQAKEVLTAAIGALGDKEKSRFLRAINVDAMEVNYDDVTAALTTAMVGEPP